MTNNERIRLGHAKAMVERAIRRVDNLESLVADNSDYIDCGFEELIQRVQDQLEDVDEGDEHADDGA